MKLRAPAYPLITVDPFFSVWSTSNILTSDDVKTWFGKTCYLLGNALIDGKKYAFLGSAKGMNIPEMNQISVDVDAFSTKYIFEASGVRLEVLFTTPVVPNRDDIFVKPISFLNVKCFSVDGNKHDITVKVSMSEQFCVQPKLQNCIIVKEMKLNNNINCIEMGGVEQNVLGYSGDDVGIDWGYLYLSAKGAKVGKFNISKMTFIFAEYKFEIDKKKSQSGLFTFAYDDIYSIKYFGKKLKAYWKKDGSDIKDIIVEAFDNYDNWLKLCNEFSNKLYVDGVKAGGEKYAEILTLSVRQIMAAHKAVVDENGNLLYISKECLSNGCAATVDVSYPSIPFYLLYNPKMIEGMLRPILDFTKSDLWQYEYAPHDVGTYPILNGQVYSCFSEKNQMPVEESGNMIIMLTALSVVTKSADLYKENKGIIDKWAKYLCDNGFNPENQLCTDDFAGHLAHNCNLSLKTIIALNSYSILCKMVGDDEKAENFANIAFDMADKWKENAKNDDGSYNLTFDNKNTFSMKYNAVWDRVFGFGLFSTQDWYHEGAKYKQQIRPYGLPLDSRSDCTKSDWMIWTATLIGDDELMQKMVDSLWLAYNLSPSRVPLTDLFSSVTSLQIHFQHRSVQGGLFMKILCDSGICRDY